MNITIVDINAMQTGLWVSGRVHRLGDARENGFFVLSLQVLVFWVGCFSFSFWVTQHSFLVFLLASSQSINSLLTSTKLTSIVKKHKPETESPPPGRLVGCIRGPENQTQTANNFNSIQAFSRITTIWLTSSSSYLFCFYLDFISKFQKKTTRFQKFLVELLMKH